MSFCTAISCIDERIHLPVIDYLQNRFGVDYVDKVTEPGPVGILSKNIVSADGASIFKRTEVSGHAHDPVGITIVAHHDCSGNPIPDSEQILQIHNCVATLSKRYPQLQVIGLWIDENWSVQEITSP